MKVSLEKIDGVDHLVVSLPLIRRRSASGKTVVVASTRGNQKTDLQVDNHEVYVGLNAYIYA